MVSLLVNSKIKTEEEFAELFEHARRQQAATGIGKKSFVETKAGSLFTGARIKTQPSSTAAVSYAIKRVNHPAPNFQNFGLVGGCCIALDPFLPAY